MQVIEPHEVGRISELTVAYLHTCNIKTMLETRIGARKGAPGDLTRRTFERAFELRDWASLLAEGHFGVKGGAK